MATLLTSATFSNTYKDDYLDSDGYYRILFNSGKTLQARELTQMQTILQKQIERIGNNLFKEGAIVSEGSFSPNSKYEFIKLNTATNSLPANYIGLVGTSFTGQTSGVIAKVLEVVPAAGSDPATLYVQYTSTLASPASTAGAIRMQSGENINNGSTSLTVQTTNTVANPAVGTGYRFSVGKGIYYSKGYFIFTENQSKIISKYSDAPTADIGFKIIEDVVTTADDTGLFDNQGSTPNLSAPGADRYRIRLVISTRDEIDSDENFIHTHTVIKGQVASTITATDSYNIPNKMIAQRIFENSGNYIVKPFTAKFELDSSSNNHLNLKISDGIAVVEGYRAAKYVPTNIRLNRAQNTITVNNDVSAAEFGNYVIATSANIYGLPNINTLELYNLRSATGYGGSTIGTARVRGVTEDGANYRFHLFDIKMNSGQAFRDVKSIGTSVTNYFNPLLESSKAVLKETNNNTLLFRLTNRRPSTVSDISLAVQRRFTTTTNASGQATISVSASGETFTNVGDWFYSKDNDAIYTGSVTVSGAGTASATISGLPVSVSNLEILAYVNKSTGLVRSKTLTSRSITASVATDPNGIQYVPLGKADIFDVTEIINAADSNQSYSNRFSLDNGQRDNFYALGRLLLRGGSSAPGGNVHVKYRHFTHGTSGDFFAVNSYTGQVAYNQIPSHRTASGTNVALRNVLDFRPVQDSDGAYSNVSTGARVNELPQPTSLITADVVYYVGLTGRLVIDTEGVIQFIRGTPGINPRLPEKTEQTLPLYNITLNPNTLNDSDVSFQKIEAKRYTMADIGKLEERVDKVEELASLSLLELATNNFEVLDSAGLNRTKSGVVVDNFTTQSLSQISSSKYRASIDPRGQTLRPTFSEDNIKLLYDSDASINTIKKGDNIYLKYDEAVYINQNLASQSIQINPFSVVVHEGVVTLSPTSDEWRDIRYSAARVIDGGTKLSTTQALLWGNWEWNWGGTPVENLTIGSTTNQKVTNSGNTTTTTVNKVVSDEVVRTEVGDRVIDVALLPYIRSRKIYFRAEGLRPNSKVFAFFDGKNVASWVKSGSFQYFSDDTVDYGDINDRATQHPDGSSTLTTDANGKVEGSFFLPNTVSTRFRTGTREFKILDISVDNESNALSVARAIYAATGYIDTRQKDILSTRVLTVEGTESVTYNYSYSNNENETHNYNYGGNYQNYPGSNTWSPRNETFNDHHSSGIHDGGDGNDDNDGGGGMESDGYGGGD